MAETTTLTDYLPLLLLAVGMLLLLPAPLLAVHRMSASITALAVVLGAAFIQLVWRADASIESLFLFAGMAQLIAAPLLERTRFLGLVTASLAGSAAILYAVPEMLAPNLPERPALALLPLSMIVAMLVGMIGGMKLPLHPQRHRENGSAVWHSAPQAVMLAGWICVALAMVFLCGPDLLGRTQVASALAAALVALFYAQMGHGQDALQKAGEGLVAGLLISLLVPLAPLPASLLGALAGFFVTRSEAMALALRLDDPHHFLGALLVPSILGLLMPGILDLSLMAAALQWLGASFALALAVSLILWPLTMFLLGMQLPARLVREGVRGR